MARAEAAGRDYRIHLAQDELGMRLEAAGEQLMFYRLDTGERLLSVDDALQAEVEAWRAESEARLAAEAELARLRDELRRRDA